jgi:hypothetical protein
LRRGITSDNRQLVGDHTNPILKPEAAGIVKKHGEMSLAGNRLSHPARPVLAWRGTMPWSATMTYWPQQGEWLESVCTENPRKYGTEKDAQVPIANKPDF